MKKIIILLALVILLTGCSANVNIKITSSGIEEEIIINAYPDSGTTKEQLSKSFRKYMPVFDSVPLSDTEPDTNKNGIEYYTRRQNDLGSGYQFIYKYNYKFDDYKNSKIIKQGFKSNTIQRNSVDKNIMISLKESTNKEIVISSQEEKFIDIMDKLNAMFGEAKAFLEKKVSELINSLKTKINQLFKIFKKHNTEDDDTKIDDDKKIFNLKTILHKIIRKKKENDDNHQDQQ